MNTRRSFLLSFLIVSVLASSALVVQAAPRKAIVFTETTTGKYPWSVSPVYGHNGQVRYTPSPSAGTITIYSLCTCTYTENVVFVPFYFVTIAEVGTGTVSPGSQYVERNTTLFLHATPFDGSSFLRWQSSDRANLSIACTTCPDTSLTVLGWGTLTAVFLQGTEATTKESAGSSSQSLGGQTSSLSMGGQSTFLLVVAIAGIVALVGLLLGRPGMKWVARARERALATT